MKIICGNEEDWLSPAAKIGEDDEASYVLFIAWSKNLPLASLIAEESGFHMKTVDRCIDVLVKNKFMRFEAGYLRATSLGDLFLRAFGFEKQEVVFSNGWGTGNALYCSNEKLAYSGSIITDEDSQSEPGLELSLAA